MRTGFDSSAMADASWPGCARSLKGVILDLCGVLYDSGEGGGSAISGSVEALKKWVSDVWLLCSGTKLSHVGRVCTVLSVHARRLRLQLLSSVSRCCQLIQCCFDRLKASDLQLRFCTNESQAAREAFVAKLQRLGFDITVPEVFSPAPAAVAALKERGLRPHLLVYDGNACHSFQTLLLLSK